MLIVGATDVDVKTLVDCNSVTVEESGPLVGCVLVGCISVSDGCITVFEVSALAECGLVVGSCSVVGCDAVVDVRVLIVGATDVDVSTTVDCNSVTVEESEPLIVGV